MQFKTPYSPSERRYCASGDFTRPTYKTVLKKDGVIELVEDGVELTYEKIQSYADSVDINLLIRRYLNGDESALDGPEGMYGDMIEVPSSLMEMLNAAIDLNTNYEKSGFDGSFSDYMKSLEDEINSVNEKSKSEVIADEQKPE